MLTRRFILSAVAIACVATITGCAQGPDITRAQIRRVRFFSHATDASRAASPEEVREFVEAYREARPFRDDVGTTAPARIEVELANGDLVVIWGGGEPFSTIGGDGVRQLNVEGERLHGLLEEIARGVDRPSLSAQRSPEQVARRYYELQAAGDVDSARMLTWRPERFDDAVPDRSLKGLTSLGVTPSREDSSSGRPLEYRELTALRMLTVHYERHKTSATGEPPGRDARFVLLGQEATGGPWLVVETGTGP